MAKVILKFDARFWTLIGLLESSKSENWNTPVRVLLTESAVTAEYGLIAKETARDVTVVVATVAKKLVKALPVLILLLPLETDAKLLG